MLRDAITIFPNQFAYEPKIIGGKIKPYQHYIVTGMGGSRLPAQLLLSWKPTLPLTIWNDYGLPSSIMKSTCVIAFSYSGNTEEVLDSLQQALKKRLPVAIVAVGGQLIELAKKKHLPYIQLPNTGIQPRSALGFSLRALCQIIGEKQGLKESKPLATTLKPLALEPLGRALAARLKNHVPIIYSSRANEAVAYNWKIKFNETGKIPAFCNVLPELNHNEMTGFDVTASSKHLSDRFYFIFLTDTADHPRIQKRMSILRQLYLDRGLPVEAIELAGKTKMEKIFSSLILADWTALYTTENYGLESEQVPMVEEFKKLMI